MRRPFGKGEGRLALPGILALAGLALAAIPGRAAAAAVSGRVTFNGQGLAGVTVVIGYQVGSFFKSALTDTAGSFVLADIANGAYHVTCSKETYGFLPESLPVTVSGSDVAGLSFTAHELFAPHTISGRVLLNGAGVGGIVLTATHESGSFVARVQTDSSGAYRVEGLNNGNTYLVRPEPSRYAIAPEYARVSVGYFDITGQDFTARLESYRVSGTVTSLGLGLEGASITIRDSLTSTSVASATTDSLGRYNVALPGWQNYRITASKPAYLMNPPQIDVGFSSTDPPGTERSGLNFTGIAESYRLSGRVLLNNAGIGGIGLKLTPEAGSPLREENRQTDAAGSYMFNVLAGTYTLTPGHPAYSFTPANQKITITAGDGKAADFISKPLTWSIRGKVLAGGLGQSGVTVALSGAATQTVTTGSGGDFVFSGLALGSYTVTPSQGGTSFTPRSRAVPLGYADANGIDFVAAPVTYAILGRTLNNAGVILSGVSVALSGTGSGRQDTDVFGSFAFRGLPAGTYTVTPTNRSGYAFKPASRAVTINASDVQGIDFTEGRPTFKGRVTLGGAGLAGVAINLMDNGGTRLLLSAMTDAAGEYAFPEIELTQFKIVPSKPGYAFNPEQMFATMSPLSPDSVQNFAATAFVPTYTISGVVSPTSTAGGVTLALTGAATRTATTGASSGYYAFSGLADGSYTVTPSKAGYVFTPASRTITLAGSEVLNASFTMSTATFALRGTVKEGSSGKSGVALSLSGVVARTATTDAGGAYGFSGLPSGNYSLIPQLAGRVFTPQALMVTITGADVSGADFTASAVPRSIRGVVTAGGSPQAGVTMSLAGDENRTATTDAAGSYAFTGLTGMSYSVSPHKTGFTFQPSARSWNAVTEIGDANFIALVSSIRGTVLLNGSGLPFVRMTLSGPVSQAVSTDGAGNYLFSVLPNGLYTIGPSAGGYAFTPASQAVEIAGTGKSGVNFTASAVTYSIRGQITNPAGGELGATVTLTGAASKSFTTDAKGNFVFEGLANGSYTVTPAKAGRVMTPASRAVTIAGGAVGGVDFSAGPQTYVIRGGVVNGTAAETGVTITLSGAAAKSTTTDGRGGYSFAGLTSGSYTVTPRKPGAAFVPASQTVEIATADGNLPKFNATFVGFAIRGEFVRNLKPEIGATIGLLDAAGKVVTTTTDKLGHFTFTGLRNGTYMIAPAPAMNPVPKSRSVSVSNADVAGVNFN